MMESISDLTRLLVQSTFLIYNVLGVLSLAFYYSIYAPPQR